MRIPVTDPAGRLRYACDRTPELRHQPAERACEIAVLKPLSAGFDTRREFMGEFRGVMLRLSPFSGGLPDRPMPIRILAELSACRPPS